MSLKLPPVVVLLGFFCIRFALTQPAPVPAASQAQPKSSAPPSAAGPAAKPAQDFSKEALVFERWYTRIVAESDGTVVRERTAEVRVLSDAGVKALAVLTLPYLSANETLDFDYVRVRKPDGTVVKTPDYNIQEMPAEVSRQAPLYSDVHEKHVAVKGLAVGDVLEYVVRVKVIKPQVPGQFWYEDSFTTSNVMRDERLEVNVPADKYVKVVSPQYKPVITEEGGRRIYRWTHTNLEVKEKDPDEVPRRVPPNPDVQITTFASWEDVGRWYGGLQKEELEVTPALQAKAAELTKGATTDEQKIRALYNFVSLKYHYIGLDFGIGRYQPHAADDVLDNGYGDCKDKHTLLAALLKAEGFEAWPALIHAQRKLDPDVPSPAQFNHVITVVPSGGDYIWLDTTPEVAPYRLLLEVLRNKQALVIPNDKPPLLMTTPANPPFEQHSEFTMKGKLASDGTFTGHVEQSYRGDSEVVMRIVFRQISPSQWRDAVQRMSRYLNFGGDVSNVQASQPDDLDTPFHFSYDYVRKDYSDWEHQQIGAPLPPMGIGVSKFEKDKKPQEPVDLGGLGKVEYRAEVELPPGYVAYPPAMTHLSEPYIEYTGDTVIQKGVMTTTRELVVKKNEVPLDQWENYRKLCRGLNDDESNYIRLSGASAVVVGKADSKADDSDINAADDSRTTYELFRDGDNALQRRDASTAQRDFEKVIAKDPKYKEAHLRLGAVLIVQGHVDDGIKELEKEQEISPNDVRAYQMPAYYLHQHGRTDEAIAEWRKLLKLDPKNVQAIFGVGSLLYQQEKYPEAADVYETGLKSDPDNTALLVAAGDTYLKAGQPGKADPALRRAAELKSDDAMLLNNVSYLMAENKLSLDQAQQYAEKAVAQVEKKSREAGTDHIAGGTATYDLSLMWDTLGWVYFEQGNLKRAEEMVRAAWLLGEEPVVSEHLGEIYEKEGKTQPAERAYLNTVAVQGVSTLSEFNTAGPRPKSPRAVASEAAALHYRKLTGKAPPMTDIHRLPNGEWTKTPAEQLRSSRQVKLPNEARRSGAAQFFVTFEQGKVTAAEFSDGDSDVDGFAAKLKAASLPLELPPGSAAILTVQVKVECEPAHPCTALVMPAVQPAAKNPAAPPAASQATSAN